MRRFGRLAIIAGAIVLVAGSAGIAGAAIVGGPVASGVIHGCYSTSAVNGSHSFALQNSGTPCPSGRTAISWNTTGGVGEIEEHTNTTVPYGQNPGSSAQAFLNCPANYTAVSGGYAYQNYLNAAAQEDWVPMASYATGNPGVGQTSGWDVVVIMSGTPYTGGGSWQLRVFVYCLPTA